jgi:hypothetical protein
MALRALRHQVRHRSQEDNTALRDMVTSEVVTKRNLPLHDISKHNKNKKNIIFGEGFCHFFISAPHFWIKHYKNFLNLT